MVHTTRCSGATADSRQREEVGSLRASSGVGAFYAQPQPHGGELRVVCFAVENIVHGRLDRGNHDAGKLHVVKSDVSELKLGLRSRIY